MLDNIDLEACKILNLLFMFYTRNLRHKAERVEISYLIFNNIAITSKTLFFKHEMTLNIL